MAAIFGPAFAGSTYQTLYSFCPDLPNCAEGGNPNSIHAAANGDLYGTGLLNDALPYTTGFIFKMKRGRGMKYSYSEFFSFPECDATCSAGENPYALVIGKSGAVYALARGGNAEQGGVLLKITPDGAEQVLYDFCSILDNNYNCTDGAGPAAITYDGAAAGKDWDETSPLYGTTQLGGHSGGTVFKYDPATGKLSTIYEFCKGGPQKCEDGTEPNGLIALHGKFLYGTDYGNASACGIVYELNLKNPKRAKALHDFGPLCDGSPNGDGENPVGGVLLSTDPINGHPDLAGLTSGGGVDGVGTEWTIDLPTGDYDLLASFCTEMGCVLGYTPAYDSNLVEDSSHNWYGVTDYGGGPGNYYGTLFVTDQSTDGQSVYNYNLGDDPDGALAEWHNTIFGITTRGPGLWGTVYMAKFEQQPAKPHGGMRRLKSTRRLK